MKFYIQKIDSDEWPVRVSYAEPWLDANSYFYRDKLAAWLQEQNIEFKQTQLFKIFTFEFKREEDSTLFVMRWT